jgi:hypothetical protein
LKLSLNRDKASLDIFWLRDESLEESGNLRDPEVLAQEIVEDLEAALEQFREIADLGVLTMIYRERSIDAIVNFESIIMREQTER